MWAYTVRRNEKNCVGLLESQSYYYSHSIFICLCYYSHYFNIYICYYNHLFETRLPDNSDMKGTKQRLIIEQVDHKLSVFSSLKNVIVPERGWVHTVRTALKMSLRQFSQRLGIHPSSARAIEQRERDGAITVRALREAASALDMQLVYGFIPKDGSLEAMIEKKAEELATEIVQRTSQTMKLEDQENSNERIQKAIKQQTEALKYDIPRALWD